MSGAEASVSWGLHVRPPSVVARSRDADHSVGEPAGWPGTTSQPCSASAKARVESGTTGSGPVGAGARVVIAVSRSGDAASVVVVVLGVAGAAWGEGRPACGLAAGGR